MAKWGRICTDQHDALKEEEKMSEYKWFVETKDDFTNECISREANEGSLEIHPRKGILCADGKKHRLWECPRSFVTEMENSQHPFRFITWVQEGNGHIRVFNPPRKKKHVIHRGFGGKTPRRRNALRV